MVAHSNCSDKNGESESGSARNGEINEAKYNLHANSNSSGKTIEDISNPVGTSVGIVGGDPIASKDSQAFNLQLILLVKTRSSLYDLNSEGYKSNETRNKEWNEIAGILQQNVEFVRTRWKTMRDRFKKEYRKYERNLPIIWPHFYEMTFVLPFFRARSGVNEDELNGDNLDLSNVSGKPGIFNSDKLGNLTDERNFAGNDLTTNYIIDFARNVVNCSNNSNGGFFQSDNASEGDDENNLENEPNLKPSQSNPGTKRDFEGEDQHIASTSTLVTTTFEHPFNFANFSNSYQNDTHVKEQSKLNSYLQLRKRGNDHIHYNNESPQRNNSKMVENGAKRRNDALDSFYSYASSSSMHNQQHLQRFAHRSIDNGYDDEEDDLFCRIMLKKMKKMSEHTKEKAKAKILDLLVQFQYGEMT